MKKTVLYFIRSYQKFFSSEIRHNMFFAGSCRFTPSCSEYTYQAVDKYGTIRGLLYGFKRILRCHPFSQGGYNPV